MIRMLLVLSVNCRAWMGAYYSIPINGMERLQADMRTLYIPWTLSEVGLFSDAELAEDEVQDVIGCCGARQGVKSLECTVKVEEDHLVGDGCGCSI
jgi:hypothetical protein